MISGQESTDASKPSSKDYVAVALKRQPKESILETLRDKKAEFEAWAETIGKLIEAIEAGTMRV